MTLRTWLLIAVGAVLIVLGGSWLLGPRSAPERPGYLTPTVELPPGVEPLAELDETRVAAASHIMIAHAEADPPVPGVTRTKAEAHELCIRVAAMASERGADFAALARRYSDDPRAQTTGGYLGIVERGQLPIQLRVNLFHLEHDQIHTASETSQGYHVLKRHPIRRALAQHILVSWEGSENVKVRTGRSKEQARMVAEEVLLECRRDDADFCELAGRFSDDSASRFDCGVLGVVVPHETGLPEFEHVLFRLDPGEVSDLVESSYGFHIIRRLQ